MAIQRSVLLIADIGGYTRFMKEHRFALAHAQEAIGTLLEAIIESAKPLKLAKLEGDAAFLYVPVSELRSDAEVSRMIANIRRGFLERQQSLSVNRLCTCKGCTEVDVLKLKFVAHVGEVAFQKVKRFTELAGVDVILVHRMLKNDVPVSEYVLMTEPLLSDLAPQLQKWAQTLEHEFEGLGLTRTHFVDLAAIPSEALPAVTPKPTWMRFLAQMAMAVRSLPYWLGFKKPCATFHNVEGEIVQRIPAEPDSSDTRRAA